MEGFNVRYTVYMYINKTNNKKYIGITKLNVKDRWQNGNGYVVNKRFYDDIETYGWDGFEHKIVETNLSKMDAAILEVDLIKKYKTNEEEYGYNINGGLAKYIGDDSTNAANFTLRITPKMKAQLEYIANNEYRTLSNMILYICAKYIEDYERNNDDIAI